MICTEPFDCLVPKICEKRRRRSEVVVFKYFFARGWIFGKSVRASTVLACRAITELSGAGHYSHTDLTHWPQPFNVVLHYKQIHFGEYKICKQHWYNNQLNNKLYKRHSRQFVIIVNNFLGIPRDGVYTPRVLRFKIIRRKKTTCCIWKRFDD